MKTNNKAKKNWLVHYCDGTLRPDWQYLLNNKLSDHIKEWLHSLSRAELTTSLVVSSVTKDLLSDMLYPTSHAFRHMWAEAIYRRFDGDAGWMIRSQFQHIAPNMWLDYIRDKDNRDNHQIVKEQVVNSMVLNYINRKGKGYAGQLHTWLRRILNRTKLATPAEQKQIANQLSYGEIENIKANPWGYCWLKRRTRSKAKCAEMGVPMRHNASPELCLGCPHNLMQTENVEWSIFHIAPHIEALNNELTPGIFKSSSYGLVKNVTKHVRTLNPLHEALPELESALDGYKTSRAS